MTKAGASAVPGSADYQLELETASALVYAAGNGTAERASAFPVNLISHKALSQLVVALQDELATTGQPVTSALLNVALRKRRLTVAQRLLPEVIAAAGLVSALESYEARLVDALRRREILAACRDAATAAVDGNLEDAEAMLSTLASRRPEVIGESSWAPVDLEEVLAGNTDTPYPDVGRCDGTDLGLFYRGKVNAISSEPGFGKTLICQAIAANIMQAKARVLYIDFEDNAVSMVSRLRSLGVTEDEVLLGLTYIRPHEAPNLPDLMSLTGIAGRDFDMTIVDGITESMTLFGLKPLDNEDFAVFAHRLLRPLADGGSALVIIDHVPKDSATRGRFAIGGQHKMAAISGAAYGIEAAFPPARGRTGTLKLITGKDRHGHRAMGTVAAIVTVTGDDETISVGFASPIRTPAGVKRPTINMERVSKLLESTPAPLTRSAIEKELKGNAPSVRVAMDLLTNEGYITRTEAGRSVTHSSIRPYRKDRDEVPDETENEAETLTIPEKTPETSTNLDQMALLPGQGI